MTLKITDSLVTRYIASCVAARAIQAAGYSPDQIQEFLMAARKKSLGKFSSIKKLASSWKLQPLPEAGKIPPMLLNGF